MKRTRLLAALVGALLVLPLAGCSAGLNQLPDLRDASVAEPAPGKGGDSAGGGFPGEVAGDTATAERSVIRSGSLSLEVSAPAEAAERIGKIASDLGGSVASQSISQRGGSATGGYVTIRVPVDRFDDAFQQLSEVGAVQREERDSVDVTAEHVDLEARVAALESSVARLTELMRGAATTSELLEAEAALSARQQELDGLKAQLKALEGQVAQATIHITLGVPYVLPGGGPDNFWDAFLAGVRSIGSFGLAVFVGLGFALPWLALLGAIAAAIVIPLRRRARRRGRAE